MNLCLATSTTSNKFYLGQSNGKIQMGQINIYSTIYYKNLMIDFENGNSIIFQDIHSDFKEETDITNKHILYVQAFNNKILVVLKNQCYLYSTDNLITPIIFETSKSPLMFAQLSNKSILLAFQAIPPVANIYDFSGKLVNTFKFPSQCMNKKLVSLSEESLVVIDPANPKILKVMDSKTSKMIS